jgi:hypothetical protein
MRSDVVSVTVTAVAKKVDDTDLKLNAKEPLGKVM